MEVVRWVVNYLVIGVIVQLGIQGLAKVIESPKLDVKESIGTMLVWPLSVLVFVWFFVRGLLRKREE